MAKNECEKIIDLAIEQGNTGGLVDKHARHCPECAAALACLLWLKHSGSPTAGFEPSASYLGQIDKKISAPRVLASSNVSTGIKAVVAAFIATALAMAIITGLWSNNASDHTSKNIVTAPSALDNANGEALTETAEQNGKIENSAPIMQFTSPADDVD